MSLNNRDYIMLKNTQSIYLLNSKIQEIENKLMNVENSLSKKLETKEYTFSATFGEWYYNDTTNNKFLPINSEGETNTRATIGLYNAIHTLPITIPDNIFEELYNSPTAAMIIQFTENEKSYEMRAMKKYAHFNGNSYNIDFTATAHSNCINSVFTSFNFCKTLDNILYLWFYTVMNDHDPFDHIIKGSTFDITIKYT